ncbi:MAG: RDD family protein [Gammaproteobacteria bacterium]|nr:MAG: RDD family protein [Gammaproteobacteria bacterium]
MERTPGLVVDSVTGVDVSLPVAGPGGRAFAFLIDWHVRAIVCIAWYVLAALVYNRRWSLATPLNPDTTWFVFVVAPAAAIFFLYHFVLEVAMHGRTPGKRMAGVHIVTRDGAPPSVGALLTRNVFRLVDSLPLFYGVGLVMTMLTSDHVRVGDVAAGTLLVYDHADVTLLDRMNADSWGGKLDAAAAEVVHELLRRWSSLDVDARRRLAREVLVRCGHETTGGSAASALADDESLRSRLEQLVRGGTP